MVGLRLLDAARAAGLTVMTWRQAAGVATPLRAVNRSAQRRRTPACETYRVPSEIETAAG
jgi:hypothetical protein